MTLKISQLTPVAAGSLDGSEPVELGIAGDKNAPNGAFLPPGYIDGLQMQWVSATAVTVSSGAAYIPSLGRVLRAPNAIALTGLALAASTLYYMYLYDNAGVPTIECVTTAPAAPYNGTARAKTGDASRRYLGAIATDSSGAILAFKKTGNLNQYLATTYNGACLVLGAGTATTPTSVSCAGVIPVTSHSAVLGLYNNDASVGVVLGTSDMGYTLSASAAPIFINANSSAIGPIALNESQALLYMFRSTPTSNLGIRVCGYLEDR